MSIKLALYTLLLAVSVCIGLNCGPHPSDVERITHTEQYKAAERAHAAKVNNQEAFWR